MSPHQTGRSATLQRAIGLVAGGVGVAAGLVWLRCLYLVVTSRFATDPAVDPHGYALIAGSVLSLPAALLTAIAVPFALPARHRGPVARVTAILLLAGTALVWAAFLTA